MRFANLLSPHYDSENDTVRRVFLFSCFTGIRKCDIEWLTYENVDFTSMTIRFNQKKIEWRDEHSGVTTPLNEHPSALSQLISSCAVPRLNFITATTAVPGGSFATSFFPMSNYDCI